MEWRCDDCFGLPVFCSLCLHDSHTSHPFHRVSHWDSQCFHRSSLDKVGVTLNLGHDGGLCLFYATSSNKPDSTQETSQEENAQTSLTALDANEDPMVQGDGEGGDDKDDDKEGSEEVLWQTVDTGGIPLKGTRKAKPKLDSDQCPVLTIVDITGIHELRTRFCRCTPHESNPLSHQLLSMGLFPSSMKNPRMVFTFRLLDDINLINLESKTSTFKYFKKLRRLTSNVFPHMVTDRYRELLRVLRQWRDVQSQQCAGELYRPEGTVLADGELGLFCAACPQPGLNIPDDWRDDKQK